MSIEQASAFLENWVVENVHSLSHSPDNIQAKRLAKRCLEDAKQQGITKADLEQASGQDLVKCMCDAQVAVADADIGELMDEGDSVKTDPNPTT
ncbi:MAG TPA: hypothetical protein VH933_05455 [Aestuariivirgaceae bacterium]|jgi:hypothetical protein